MNMHCFNISIVFQYLRKVSGLSQENFGKEIGWSPFKVSEVESGQTVPFISDMNLALRSDLLKKYELKYDHFLSGKLELPSHLLHSQEKELFDLPLHYREHASTKGRLLKSYITNFIDLYGAQGFINFCEQEKVHPAYFANINNDVNMLFVQRMLQVLREKNFLTKEEEVSQFCHLIATNAVLGAQNRDKLSNPVTRVVSLLESASKFEENHDYEICETDLFSNSLIISVKPKEHVSWKLWHQDPLIGGLAENLIGNILKGVAGSGYKWKYIERANQGTKCCKIKIYQAV